jgi:DNA-directed RNA polymerase specialized sigma24 family protein
MVAFPSTRWSLIQASERPAGEIAAAWRELVRDYRPAIVGFFRRSALARDADDLAQEFLLRSMQEQWWSRADREVGSFRRFLGVLLHRFLAQQRELAHRRKEVNNADIPEATDCATPETYFDVEFALCVARAALADLHEDYEHEGRAELFEELQQWLIEPPEHGALAELGARLHVAPNTLAVQLKRFRFRYQRSIRAVLVQLSVDADSAETEFAALRTALIDGGTN